MSKLNPEWYELQASRWFDESTTDSQRSKVYTSERCLVCYCQNFKIPYRKFESLEEISEFVNKLIQSAWVTKRWGKQKPVTILESKRSRICYAKHISREIYMHPTMMNIFIVLHELAHILKGSIFGYACNSHGRFFARTYLELVEHLMGSKIKKEMKRQYIRNNVKSTPVIYYSPEVLSKLQERGRQLAAGIHSEK